MAAPSALLNAEPALPSEREQQHLPPKSYADAVEETPPTSAYSEKHSVLQKEESSNGVNGTRNGKTTAESTRHTASVLRIVNTGAEPKDEKPKKPELERQESKHEYSATVCQFLCYSRPPLITSGP